MRISNFKVMSVVILINCDACMFDFSYFVMQHCRRDVQCLETGAGPL